VTVKGKNLTHIVLADCPFYAESGGQVGDTGILVGEDGETIHIVDTTKENKLHILVANQQVKNATQLFKATVDEKRRLKISANHSATHLMHSALQRVLGTHVAQKGSLVNDETLRFDFSHFGKMTEEEIASVEQMVNAKIQEGIALIEHRNIPIQNAIDMGATALFGEKYGDFVRVIEFDREEPMLPIPLKLDSLN
jgi:alanyl-tRNA synthetase